MESVVQWCIAERDVKVFDQPSATRPTNFTGRTTSRSLHQQVHAHTPKGAAAAAYRQRVALSSRTTIKSANSCVRCAGPFKHDPDLPPRA